MLEIEYELTNGSEASKYFNELASLRIEVFREFPYLYEGTIDYEKKYLESYFSNPKSLVIFAKYKNEIVGASTCIPLEFETEEFQKAFQSSKFDITKIMYFGESIIKKQYRGNKIGHRFFELREQYSITSIPNLEFSCFCSVLRSENHPLRPTQYKDLSQFWTRMGYARNEDVFVQLPWLDINKKQEDLKRLNFWFKNWRNLR